MMCLTISFVKVSEIKNDNVTKKTANVHAKNKLWELAEDVDCRMDRLMEMVRELEDKESVDLGKLTGAENRRLRNHIEENFRKIGEEERKKLWQ